MMSITNLKSIYAQSSNIPKQAIRYRSKQYNANAS